MTNWLSNLFAIADRYMIIHFSGLTAAAALEQVGNYHSARLVPMLLFSLSAMLASMITPHLSHDWEIGRRRQVAVRLNLTLKLVAFCLIGAAAVILIAAPVLFDVVFEKKFDGGLAVLPGTLVYCTWAGLACIAPIYLWCAEKPGLVSVSLLVGFAVNIALNLLLLPLFGLAGAVLATSAAHVVALAFLYLFSMRRGMAIGTGTWLVSAVPVVFLLGPWVTLAVLAALGLGALQQNWLLSREERSLLLSTWKSLAARWLTSRWSSVESRSLTENAFEP
jgi:O-antigen/teichoic acid export membrane protein